MILNMDALRWNLAQMPHLEQEWNFTFMPVLKMVACHPAVVKAARQAGYARYGAAEVDEALFWQNGEKHPSPARPGEGPVLISLPPLHRADDVVRLFGRCPADSLEALEALEAASARRGKDAPPYECVIMLDLGDMREGIPVEYAGEFFRSVRNRFEHLSLTGLGVTMGCLHGACPDFVTTKELGTLAAMGAFILGHSFRTISLGGSIFWDWWARYHKQFACPPDTRVELRIADPILMGYDSYHEKDSAGGQFRRDLFRLDTTVLEVMEKDLRQPRSVALNGQGKLAGLTHTGRRKRVLLDCGILHTNVNELKLDIPGTEIVDFSGNYTILDVTDSPRSFHPGETVSFTPGYWAVAQSFRNPMVPKYCVSCA